MSPLACAVRGAYNTNAPHFRRAGRWFERVLKRANVLGLQSLLSLNDVELNFLVFFQRAVAAGGDGREVCEHVRPAVILADEAEPLFGVEPFDGACCHADLFLLERQRRLPHWEPARDRPPST